MRPRVFRIAAAVLACTCALAPLGALAGCAPSGYAWADLDNPTVPTDDTGVVTTPDEAEQPQVPDAPQEDQPEGAEEGESSAEGGSADEGAHGEGSDTPDSGDAANADGTGGDSAEAEGTAGKDAAEGDAAAEGSEAPTAADQAPGLATDPVFGSQLNTDNLINAQQKPDSSFIYDTSISALQEADAYLNDQTVQVTGEVVGDRLNAEFDPGYCWIVLQSNEDNYAEIPVFMTLEFSEPIDTYGSYGRKGTTLQIRGIFHLACPEHEGLTDLHADTVNVVEKGSITKQRFSLRAFAPGMGLVLLGLLMLLVFRHMREGQR